MQSQGPRRPQGPRGRHLVRKYSLRAGKSFLPGKPKYSLRSFQNCLRDVWGKIRFAKNLLESYGLGNKTFLGGPSHNPTPVAQVAEEDLSEYLYDTVIHPQFFADTLHLIATHAKILKPRLASVNLRNLRREQIEKAIEAKKIKQEQLDQFFGYNFTNFSKLPVQQRIKILEILGVLSLEPGTSLPLFPSWAQRRATRAKVLEASVAGRRGNGPPRPQQLSLLAILARKTRVS